MSEFDKDALKAKIMSLEKVNQTEHIISPFPLSPLQFLEIKKKKK